MIYLNQQHIRIDGNYNFFKKFFTNLKNIWREKCIYVSEYYYLFFLFLKRGKAITNSKIKLISDEDICQKLFEPLLPPGDKLYDKTHTSYLKNCTENIKQEITVRIGSYDTFDKDAYDALHKVLSKISKSIFEDILASNYKKAFIEAILRIIKEDVSISEDTIVGMNQEYMKANLCEGSYYDVNELLVNIIYYTFTLKDNKRGRSTLSALNNEFIQECIHSTNYFSFDNEGNCFFNTSRHTTTFDSIVFPKELTNSLVINSSFENVLYREQELKYLMNLIHNEKRPNLFLYGMGGTGKTSLARLLYFQLKNEYDCHGWINYSGDIKHSMISSLAFDIYDNDATLENDMEKKWQILYQRISNNKQSKLFVIFNFYFF